MKKTFFNKQVKKAMGKLIARFKRTPQGFTCGEYDVWGMYNFLTRESEEDIASIWKISFEEMHSEIAVIKSFIEEEKNKSSLGIA